MNFTTKQKYLWYKNKKDLKQLKNFSIKSEKIVDNGLNMRYN